MNGEYGVVVAGVSPVDYRLPVLRWAPAERYLPAGVRNNLRGA
jgi:hypothetical protein